MPRMVMIACAMVALCAMGCVRKGAEREDDSASSDRTVAHLTCASDAKDPLAALDAWLKTPPDAAARQALEPLGEHPTLVRAWRAEERRWSAIIASQPEPDTTALAILVELAADERGIWRVIAFSQTPSDTLWVGF